MVNARVLLIMAWIGCSPAGATPDNTSTPAPIALLPFTATYQAQLYAPMRLNARAQIDYQQQDQLWRYRLKTENFWASISEQSLLQITPHTSDKTDTLIRPERYRYRSRILGLTETRQIEYDDHLAQLTVQVDDEAHRYATVIEGQRVYDPLSFQVDLRYRLVNAQFDTQQPYQVIRYNRPVTYYLTAVDEQPLSVAGRLFQSLHIRQHSSKDQYTDLWLASGFQYIPLQIQTYKQGKLTAQFTLEHATLGQQRL